MASLRWRRNAFLPTSFICPVDGNHLSRSHINHSVELYVEPLLGHATYAQWQEERTHYPEGKYTVLDFLLNHHLFDIFMDCCFILFNVE